MQANMIIPGLLPAGLTVLSASHREDRTTFSLDLALAVARNKHKALGKFEGVKGGVLLIAVEEDMREIKGWLSRIIPDGEEWPEAVAITHEWHPIDGRGEALLMEYLACHPDTRLVILSPWELLSTQDPEKDQGIGQRLSTFGKERGIAFLIVKGL